MKKTCLFAIALLLLCPTVNFAQFNSSEPRVTIGQIADTIAAALDAGDTLEGGGHDHLLAFRTFWNSRVSMNDSSGTNMFHQYYQRLDSAITARLTGTGCSGSGLCPSRVSSFRDSAAIRELKLIVLVDLFL